MNPHILNYRKDCEQIEAFTHSHNETNIRRSFINLINAYAKEKNLLLIEEESIKNQQQRIIPDGVLKDRFRAQYGIYEAKDAKDDIDKEIHNKIHLKGYPTENTLFENSQTAVLYQDHGEVMRSDIAQDEQLDEIIRHFVDFKRKEIDDFEKAIQTFKENIPRLTESLRQRLENANQQNSQFVAERNIFLRQCQAEINPSITAADIREMIIQHILTRKLFQAIFSEFDFHRENNIARQVNNLASYVFDRKTNKDFEDKNKHFYSILEEKAKSVRDHHDKQGFLKSLYEEFYKAYNPKAADKLGVVYTPTAIVKFMIESTDFLLGKHFNTGLASRGVNILDPATGTGTFIADVIDYIPNHYLEQKYREEIFANEVAILPYYIAALNIEYIYWQKMHDYQEFGGLAFVDTLDNHFSLSQSNRQQEIGFTLTHENTARIKRQNAAKISVIIGNPPYNAHQQNYNDQNANRAYAEIDRRLKESFVKASVAQRKGDVYDMYVRFYRWAMDRLDEKKGGIIAFVTNNSFLRARAFDGFRKVVQRDFDYIYLVDLGGNIRELSEKDGIFLGAQSTHVFGIQAAMVGICIAFFYESTNWTQPMAKGYDSILYILLIFEATREEQKLNFLKRYYL